MEATALMSFRAELTPSDRDKKMKLRFPVFAFALMTSFAPLAAHADDVTDQIQQAQKAYDKRDFIAAAAALDVASNLLRQASAEVWKVMLPNALPGWKADDAEATVVGGAILGGGTHVARTYRKGDKSVEVSLTADSPMLQGVGSLLNTGLFSEGDNKLVIIDGRKMNYSKSESSYTAMVGKAMVVVKGEGVDDATVQSYLKAVNFDEIEKRSAK